MGRPYGTNNVMRTAEEKERIVLEYLNTKQSMTIICSKYNIYLSNLQRWVRLYKETGIDGLKSKTGKHKNPNLGKYNRHPTEIDKLKKELMRKDIEIARLKKGYQVRGVGQQKEFVSINAKNIK